MFAEANMNRGLRGEVPSKGVRDCGQIVPGPSPIICFVRIAPAEGGISLVA
jgi:hypothetical protein